MTSVQILRVKMAELVLTVKETFAAFVLAITGETRVKVSMIPVIYYPIYFQIY